MGRTFRDSNFCPLTWGLVNTGLSVFDKMEEVAWLSGLRCWTRDLEVPGSNSLSILGFVLNSLKFNSSTALCKLTRLVRLPLVENLISLCSI